MIAGLPSFEANAIQWVLTLIGGVSVVCMLKIVMQMGVIAAKVEYMAENLVKFGTRVEKQAETMTSLDKHMGIVEMEIQRMKDNKKGNE